MGDIFGQKIKALRKAREFSLEELGQKVGVCKGYLSGLEKGSRRPPSDKVIRNFAKALGVNVKSLLRLAHIEKISREVKQELKSSIIFTPAPFLSDGEGDIGTILRSGTTKTKETVTLPSHYVPLIGQDKFPEGFSHFSKILDEAKERVPFEHPGIPVSFALQMPDSSMLCKNGISFPKGCLVFFSPLKRLRVGEYVFAVYRREKTFSSIFRQLKSCKGNKISLASLNKNYEETILSRQTIEAVFKCIGYLHFLS